MSKKFKNLLKPSILKKRGISLILAYAGMDLGNIFVRCHDFLDPLINPAHSSIKNFPAPAAPAENLDHAWVKKSRVPALTLKKSGICTPYKAFPRGMSTEITARGQDLPDNITPARSAGKFDIYPLIG